MTKLSSVIIAKDEEDKIAECIKSLKFCDEVVVIDDDSIDQTALISKKFGARVYNHSLNNDFAQQRNFSLKKAKYDWVLFVDADERVTVSLANEIKQKIESNRFSGYFLKRRDIWMGKALRYGEVGNTCLIRLGRKSAGRWVRSVHEHWLIDGKVGKMRESLQHYPHPTISEFLDNINKYAQLHAQSNDREGKKATILHILFYPPAKLIYFYLFKLGFLDGIRGFIVAVLMSFHSYLSWSTLWLNQKINYKST